MHFDDLASGSFRRPESADRYNAVNRLLRAPETHSAAGTLPVRTLTVDVRNDSAAPLAAYTSVKLGEPLSPRPRYSPPGFSAVAAQDPFKPWGLTTDRIAPGQWGRAVVQGIAQAVPATDANGRSPAFAAGDRLLPTAEGLIPGDTGALTLAPAEAGVPATVALGPWIAPYAGDFRVWCATWSERRFQVGPGRTVFPGCEHVAAAEVTLPAGYSAAMVFLVVSYTRLANGTPVYSAGFSVAGTPPDGELFAFQLAVIRASGRVEQTTAYRDGVLMPGWML